MGRSRGWISVGLIGVAAMLFAACGGGGGGGSNDNGDPVGTDPAEPTYASVTLSTDVDNLLLPLIPGTMWVYEGETDEGTERVEVFVSHVTHTVDGVECTVVLDRAYLDDELVEETYDWYAQDGDGNIWYMGEDSVEIEDGIVVSAHGSWEGGVDGAVPGILIKRVATVGDSYQQEFYAGEAEDMAEVVEIDVTVTLEDGSSYLCVKTIEWNPLEEDSEEYKYYAPGVGLVKEESIDGSESLELVEMSSDMLPEIDPADFVTVVDNPYFPLTPGVTHHYEGETDEGLETIEVTVTDQVKFVMGVRCVVVLDRVWIDGDLAEETFDWYAQDDDGNVWYFGENSKEIENGVPINTEGSWEAGVDGARPGIIMLADPRVGDTYRQEYFGGEAEDLGEVLARDAIVLLSNGTQHSCLKTLDWNPLEEDSEEHKYYAPGIGMVLESDTEGGEPIELVSMTTK